MAGADFALEEAPLYGVAGGVSEDRELLVEQGESMPGSLPKLNPCSIRLAAQALFRDFMKASLLKTSEPVVALELELELVGQITPRLGAVDLPVRLRPFVVAELELFCRELVVAVAETKSGVGLPVASPPACCCGAITRAFLRLGWYL